MGEERVARVLVRLSLNVVVEIFVENSGHFGWEQKEFEGWLGEYVEARGIVVTGWYGSRQYYLKSGCGGTVVYRILLGLRVKVDRKCTKCKMCEFVGVWLAGLGDGILSVSICKEVEDGIFIVEREGRRCSFFGVRPNQNMVDVRLGVEKEIAGCYRRDFQVL
jgi:hypothetical protein